MIGNIGLDIIYIRIIPEEEIEMATDELSLLVQHIVRREPARIPHLAKRAEKRCSTLLREADPQNKRAKMGIETLLSVMEASGDVSPLVYMAHQMGLELVKLPGIGDEDEENPL